MQRRTTFLAAVLLLGAAAITMGAEMLTKLKISNVLGVSTTVEMDGFPDVNVEQKSVVEGIFANEYRFKQKWFLLKMEEGVYMAIPFGAFKEAVAKDGTHTVTLNNGKTVQGQLLGTINTAGGKVYALPSTTNIRIVETPDKPEKVSGHKWQLTSSKPKFDSVLVTAPAFAFSYNDRYKSGGMFYTWETGSFSHITESFTILVGGQRVPGNLSDFATISTDSGENPTITLTSQSGVSTAGRLILQYEDKNATGWTLMVRPTEYQGALLFLVNPTCKLVAEAKK